ncbi:MAG: hypothetical protein ACPG5L_15880 [Vibrio gallaecicus]
MNIKDLAKDIAANPGKYRRDHESWMEASLDKRAIAQAKDKRAQIAAEIRFANRGDIQEIETDKIRRDRSHGS